MASSSPTENLDDCPILAEGYSGGCANELQTELNIDDRAGLPVDGTFGPLTRQAVISFQQQNGIVPADGIVGPQTKAALDKENSVATPEPGAPLPSPGNSSLSTESIDGGTPVDVIGKPGKEIDGGCTAGFAVRRVTDGKLFMVTAGHCRNYIVPHTFGLFHNGKANPVTVYPAGTRTTALAARVDCSSASTTGNCITTSETPSDIFAWAPDTAVPAPDVTIFPALAGQSTVPILGEMSPLQAQQNKLQACWSGRASEAEVCGPVIGDRDSKHYFGIGKVLGRSGDSGSLVYVHDPAGSEGVYALGMVVSANSSLLPTSLWETRVIPMFLIEQNLGVQLLTAP
jgi:Putative peptidoglycan binding domain